MQNIEQLKNRTDKKKEKEKGRKFSNNIPTTGL